MSNGFIVFIRHADKVLLLKRSDEVSDFNSMWDGVYGVGDPNDVDHVLTRVEDATSIPTCLLYTSPSPRDRG